MNAQSSDDSCGSTVHGSCSIETTENVYPRYSSLLLQQVVYHLCYLQSSIIGCSIMVSERYNDGHTTTIYLHSTASHQTLSALPVSHTSHNFSSQHHLVYVTPSLTHQASTMRIHPVRPCTQGRLACNVIHTMLPIIPCCRSYLRASDRPHTKQA